ncbi:hypothetical protein [uncultured Imperialibacter sp.]|uniref:hypothetical protein n=1 Tax=uncultured Imperialibacter sp. TaxID=1672639 RepID=UPI0030D8E97B|tara:strand:- start:7413 stop:7661 length:249 start_codon:yes stop_codon:yes gene_type:complete
MEENYYSGMTTTNTSVADSPGESAARFTELSDNDLMLMEGGSFIIAGSYNLVPVKPIALDIVEGVIDFWDAFVESAKNCTCY